MVVKVVIARTETSPRPCNRTTATQAQHARQRHRCKSPAPLIDQNILSTEIALSMDSAGTGRIFSLFSNYLQIHAKTVHLNFSIYPKSIYRHRLAPAGHRLNWHSFLHLHDRPGNR